VAKCRHAFQTTTGGCYASQLRRTFAPSAQTMTIVGRARLTRAGKGQLKKSRATSGPGIKSLELGLHVLSAAASFSAPTTLTQLARASRMQLSTCRRYLVSLINAGLVKQDSAGKYDLGEKLFLLGLRAMIRSDIVRATMDQALALNQELDRTVIVSVWGDRGPTVIAWFDSSSILITNSYIGSVFSLLSTATGRVFLAYMPQQSTAGLIAAQLAQRGALTRTQRNMIERLRRSVRQDSLGSTDGEVIPGMSAVATPVFDAHGKIAAVIAILAGSHDLTGAAREAAVTRLKRAASQSSAAQGFVGSKTHGSFTEWLETVSAPPALTGHATMARHHSREPVPPGLPS
jgi:DNA-binding IclR family transcriptional regulator